MSAVADAQAACERIFPQQSDTVERFAERLFNTQMMVYSANAGCDLTGGFLSLSASEKQGWLDYAQRRLDTLVAHVD